MFGFGWMWVHVILRFKAWEMGWTMGIRCNLKWFKWREGGFNIFELGGWELGMGMAQNHMPPIYIYICIYMFRIWKCVKYIVGLLAFFFWASWPAQLGLATNGMGTHVWTIFWLGNDDNLLESLDFRLMEFAFHLDCSKCWLGMCAEGEEWGQRRWERTDTIRYDWIFFILKV
jgi:hypothetical protein